MTQGKEVIIKEDIEKYSKSETKLWNKIKCRIQKQESKGLKLKVLESKDKNIKVIEWKECKDKELKMQESKVPINSKQDKLKK